MGCAVSDREKYSSCRCSCRCGVITTGKSDSGYRCGVITTGKGGSGYRWGVITRGKSGSGYRCGVITAGKMTTTGGYIHTHVRCGKRGAVPTALRATSVQLYGYAHNKPKKQKITNITTVRGSAIGCGS